MCQFPFDMADPIDLHELTRLSGYQLVLLNSEYSKRWFSKLLNDSISHLVEPPPPDRMIFTGRPTGGLEVLTPRVLASVRTRLARALRETTRRKVLVNRSHLAQIAQLSPFEKEVHRMMPHLGHDMDRLRAAVTGLRLPSLEVLYPAVDAVVGDAAEKIPGPGVGGGEGERSAEENRTRPLGSRSWRRGAPRCIVLVGRIFEGRQSKGHTVALRAIEELARMRRARDNTTSHGGGGSESGDVELHFVGQLQHGNEAFLEELRSWAYKLRYGATVHFHVSAPNRVLRRVMESCHLQWHCTGIDVRLDPASFEHFGISIVESMAAGLIPVVVNDGGGAEIVGSSGDFGVAVADEIELVGETHRIMNLDPEVARATSMRVRQRAENFTRKAFNARLAALLSRFSE